MEKTLTLEHFERDAFDTLNNILFGNTISAGCGTHKIEKTAWHIQMSPSFAKLLLEQHSALAMTSTQSGGTAK